MISRDPTSDLSVGRVELASKRWARRACGALAVGGGASGLVSSLAEAAGFSSLLTFAIWLLFTLAYIAGIWIGVRLIENEPGTWKLLKAYMWLQVPAVQSDTVTYFFGSLMSYSCVYAGGGSFRSVFAPASGWMFALFTAQPAFGVGINAVPVCILVVLAVLKLRR